jgi:hypothetical protein
MKAEERQFGKGRGPEGVGGRKDRVMKDEHNQRTLYVCMKMS